MASTKDNKNYAILIILISLALILFFSTISKLKGY